jgi:hypothetical protein
MSNRNDHIILTKDSYTDDCEEFVVRFNDRTLSFVNEFICTEDACLSMAFNDVYRIPDVIIEAFKLGQENPNALISVVETEDI